MENNARFFGGIKLGDLLRMPCGTIAIYRLRKAEPRERQLAQNHVTGCAAHCKARVKTKLFTCLDNASMTEVITFMEVEIIEQGQEKKMRGRPKKEPSNEADQ